MGVYINGVVGRMIMKIEKNTSISSKLASSITPASSEFVKSTNKPFDWVKVDDDGSNSYPYNAR
jgi:hypothetical protein